MQATTPTPKTPRLSKTARLEKEIAELTAARQRAEAEAVALKDAIKKRDLADQNQTARIQALESKLREARAALAPFFEKTKDWEGQWPGDNIALTRRLTFGDLKKAREVYIALGK